MRWWLQQTSSVLQARRLSHKAPAETPTFPVVAPMVTTKWGQSNYYNWHTPTFNDEHAPTGCVATAMAQILNYNRYPESAHFIGHYYTEKPNADGSNIHSADVNNQYHYPYELAYGAYLPDGGNPKDPYQWKNGSEDGEAVSMLMRDCGYSVNMIYSAGGSSAVAMDAAAAFVKKFNYPATAVNYYSKKDFFGTDTNLYTDEEWLQLVSSELQKGFPILYGGVDSKKGGHAFILHGMNEDGLVYVNWGWQGAYDGYYAIDILSSDMGDFSAEAEMVLGIHPQALEDDFVHSEFITFVPYSFGWDTDKDHPLRLYMPEPFYCHMLDAFKGRFYIVYEDLTTGEVTYEDYWEKEVEYAPGEGWQTPTGEGWGATPLAPNHIYHLYMASQTEGERGYSPIRLEGGAIYYTLTVDAEGVPSISGPDFLYTGVKKVPVAMQKADANITRVYDMQGRLVHSAPTASFNLWDVPARGVLIIKQGDSVRKVAR